MRIDYETVERYCDDANKTLRDMHQDGILHDPRKAEHVKMLFSIMEKGKCMTQEGYSQRGYSGADSYGQGSYGGMGSYRGGYSQGGRDPIDRERMERERMERFGVEQGRW